MNKKLNMLAKRRHLLLTQAAIQRELLLDDLAPWKSRLAMAERGMAAIRYVKSHPALLLGGVTLLGLLRPGVSRFAGSGKPMRLLQTGMATFKIAQRLYRMLPKNKANIQSHPL